MTIGELARRTDLTTGTIRFYESIGLLPEPARRPSGYRAYGEQAEARLAFVTKAKQLGLSLAEIRSIIGLAVQGPPCEHVLALLDAQVVRVARAREQLAGFERELRQLRAEARRQRRPGRVCAIVEHARIDVDIAPYRSIVRANDRQR